MHIDRNDHDVLTTERSTESECDSLREVLEQQYGPTYEDEDCDDLEPILLCRLNQGQNVDSIEQHCTLIDTYHGDHCVDAQDLMDENDYTIETEGIIDDVVQNTSDCTPCNNPDPEVGCRTIVFSGVTCSDEDCGDEHYWYSYEANVYCCK